MRDPTLLLGDGYRSRPNHWRWALVALSTLILCSCRSSQEGWPGAGGHPAGAGPPPGPPPMAYVPEGFEQGPPMPYAALGPWAPPGIARPWPEDEYLHDGGDGGLPARVTPEREVLGLELEDTVAHFDTLDGHTLVEPSNRVHIYSPRFGAVRQVVNVVASEQQEGPANVHLPAAILESDDVQIAGTSRQHLQTLREVGQRSLTTYQSQQGDGALSRTLGPRGFSDAFLPYENFLVIRQGVFDAAEAAYLARGTSAAEAWARVEQVEVILDRKAAIAASEGRGAAVIFSIDEPPANPQLRLIKVASTPFAQPGDVIHFTLRFDNVGNEPIDNVTLIDNLTTRLEYVEGSAQSSRDTDFSTAVNQGDSLALRWVLAEPLEPGEGGVVRFECRVR